jgi:hypothetical protein
MRDGEPALVKMRGQRAALASRISEFDQLVE